MNASSMLFQRHGCGIHVVSAKPFIDLINAVIDRQVFLHDWEHLVAAMVLPD